MRQLAELLSDRGVASLRYDKVGTGKTGLGPYEQRPTDVVSAIYTSGAKAAVRFLADQPGTDKARISVYALGEGTIHAMSLAADTAPGAPKIHSLGLFQPLPGRYLDIITDRVRADAKPRDAGDLAGRRRRGPHQGHRARAAARGARRHPQPGQRQGRRRGRQDRPAGAGRQGARRHAGAVDVFGLRRPGQVRRRCSR